MLMMLRIALRPGLDRLPTLPSPTQSSVAGCPGAGIG
jgi:hypothetical protein